MNKDFLNFLYKWPKPYLREQDLLPLFLNDHERRYDTVKYAIRKGILKNIKRGLYLLNLPYSSNSYDSFEIAQIIHGPSYVSLESALSFYGWIPERVNSCTSVTSKRSKEFITEISKFSYSHVPIEHFMLQVQRIQSPETIFLIAEPWKAIADHIYVRHRPWDNLNDMIQDLRLDEDLLFESNFDDLQELSNNYASSKVRKMLTKFKRELKNELKNN